MYMTFFPETNSIGVILMCPYYGKWKIHILFWESLTSGWHACMVKKLFLCLIMCIYFFLTCSTTPKRFAQRWIFPNQSFAVTLLCGDWSDWSHFHYIMPSWAVLLCVQRYRGNRYFTAPNAVHSDKEWICIFIQINAKRPTSGRAIC